jgi:hypothetical protein
MRETVDNSRQLESLPLDVLRRQTRDPMLRWSVPDAGVLGAWRLGESIAVARDRGLRRALPAPWVLLLGEAAELSELAELVPDLLGSVPGGVTISAPAYPLLPTGWGLRVRGRWDYLLTSSPPPVPSDVRVQEVHDEEAISALLTQGTPTPMPAREIPRFTAGLGCTTTLGLLASAP